MQIVSTARDVGDKSEKKLQTFDSSYFLGKSQMHNYLLLQLVFKYFKTPTNNDKVIAWKFKS